MHSTIKIIIITHIYGSNYTWYRSYILFKPQIYIYIYIYMSLAPFFIVYLYYTFHLLHNINSPRTEFKKKKN